MINLILVRHGQSQWNKERRFTGWADIDLTEKGRSEAKYAGELIKKLNIEIQICFTSKLIRAINSSSIILKILNKQNIELYQDRNNICTINSMLDINLINNFLIKF